jgi:transcriptional regulator with XRE-family HTH domain
MTDDRADRLRTIREGLRLSQYHFGVVLGFDNPTKREVIERVNRYESGARDPPETIVRLATMLNRHGIPDDFWSREYPEDAAERFHGIRTDLDLTVIDYGVVLGFRGTDKTISSQIRRYEDGSREVPPWTLRLAQMMERLGVPDEYLIDDRVA